jgi:S-adenosyl methyltransferase
MIPDGEKPAEILATLLEALPPGSYVVARLVFNGLDLVPPGVVLTSEWRNDDPEPHPTPADVSAYGGVARKP